MEPDLDTILKEVVESRHLEATNDSEYAILNSDISLIAVGTYSSADGHPDLRSIFKVMDEIGTHLKKKDSYHNIFIRSTVPPGTTSVALSRVEESSNKKLNADFGGGMNPEFLREGKALEDFYKPPFIVFGASSKESETALRDLYSFIDTPAFCVEIRLAEILKYTCNIFHALKVAFGNEIGRVCAASGINSQKLMSIFSKDNILNISEKYLIPGGPFGGSCLPKDLRGFISFAKSKGVQIPLLDSILDSNDSHFAEIIRRIDELNLKKIGILGLTFKENTDDIRESFVVKLVRCLIDRGYSISIFDQFLQKSSITGTNKELLERSIPEFDTITQEEIQELFETNELIVITNNGYTENTELQRALQTSQCKVLDISGAYKTYCQPGNYLGFCW